MEPFIFKSIAAFIIAFGIIVLTKQNPFWFLVGWFAIDLVLYLCGFYD